MSASALKSTPRYFARVLALAALLAFVPAARLPAQEQVYDENSVKAAFLYHFSTFVVWPDTAPAGKDFVIAVLGDDEIARELETYLPGRSIQGRPMRVRRIDSVAALSDEAVLYIGAARSDDLSADLDALSGLPVLVVTDAPGALEKGSMINFKIVDRRVRFEIALNAAERAGLMLSSRLLSAAMFVDTTSAVMELPSMSIVSNDAGRSYR